MSKNSSTINLDYEAFITALTDIIVDYIQDTDMQTHESNQKLVS